MERIFLLILSYSKESISKGFITKFSKFSVRRSNTYLSIVRKGYLPLIFESYDESSSLNLIKLDL